MQTTTPSYLDPPPEVPSVSAMQVRLEQARDALRARERETEEALGRFDQHGGDELARELREAREAEAVAREHVARAERLLERSQAPELVERREAKEATIGELEAELSPDAMREAEEPFVQAEVDAVLAIARARVERKALRAKYRATLSRLRRLRSELGIHIPGEDGAMWVDEEGRHRTGRADAPEGDPDRIASPHTVLARLERELRPVGAQRAVYEQLAQLLRDLRPEGS